VFVVARFSGSRRAAAPSTFKERGEAAPPDPLKRVTTNETRYARGSAASVNARNVSAKSLRVGSGDTNPVRTSATG
jgi:hypothetical protein